MRRTLVPALLALLLCAGCFGGDDEQAAAPPPAATVDDGVSAADAARPAQSLADPEPTRAALAAKPSAALRRQLDGGATALVDLVGSMAIEPEEIEFAKGGRMLELRWSRWTDRGAEGTGQMEGVVCDPDCARGRLITVPATIRLSRPVACPAGRFFDHAEIVPDSDDPEAKSNSWLAAPC